MCEWGVAPVQVSLCTPTESGRTQVPVDPCIAPIVQALNDAGVATTSSCCGHGHLPGSIALADGRGIVIAAGVHLWRSCHKCGPAFARAEREFFDATGARQ